MFVSILLRRGHLEERSRPTNSNNSWMLQAVKEIRALGSPAVPRLGQVCVSVARLHDGGVPNKVKDTASSFYILKPVYTAVPQYRTALRGRVLLVCCLTHSMTEGHVPQDDGICASVRSAPTVILFSRHDFLTLEMHKYVRYTLTSDLASIPCSSSHG